MLARILFLLSCSSPDLQTGNSTHPNTFSDALVNILQDKLGVPLWIRIGGTSADQDHYNSSQKAAVVRPNPPIEGHGLWGYSIGDLYFDALLNFKKSKFIWMIPMAYPSGKIHLGQDALIQSRKAIQKIGTKLAMLELGNEPNLYIGQKVRGANYNVAQYVKEALQHHDDVEGNFTSLPEDIKYQTLVYASNVDQSVWNTEKAFNAGINANGMVGSVSWHYYQSVTDAGVTLGKTLMVRFPVSSQKLLLTKSRTTPIPSQSSRASFLRSVICTTVTQISNSSWVRWAASSAPV